MPKDSQTITWIQILRGIAASLIVLAHLRYQAIITPGVNLFGWHEPLSAGVDIFFVISGFIMMLVTDPATGRKSRPGAFLANRITRIVPLYWVYTLLLTIGAIVVPSILRWTVLTPDIVIRSLLFIPSFHPVDGEIHPLLAQGWTLQYEMFFYICFTFLIGLTTGARIIAMAVLFAALSVLAGMVGRETALMAFVGDTIIFEFVAGMALYWAWRRGWVVTWAAIPIALIVLPGLIWAIGSGAAAPFVTDLDQQRLRFIVWGIPSLLVVYVFLAMPEVSGPVARGLTRIGDASYSLYLGHSFVVAAALLAWSALGHESSAAFRLLLVFPLAIIASLIAYAVVERPLLALSRRAVRALAERPEAAPTR